MVLLLIGHGVWWATCNNAYNPFKEKKSYNCVNTHFKVKIEILCQLVGKEESSG